MEEHKSVLLNEFLQNAPEKPGAVLWDGTLGMGGHFSSWLKQCPAGFGYGSDTDSQMLELCSQKLSFINEISGRYELVHGEYSKKPCREKGPFDYIFLDLGISSLHLDHFPRGITFREDQDLDMRLDPQQGIPVSEWLKKVKVEDLIYVLRHYGEEKLAAKIARAIIKEREENEITTTAQLRKICEEVYPAAWKLRGDTHTKRNPAVKTFQAFRIFINRELEVLKEALTFLPDMLKPGGRLFIITFHSLEDRAVKHAFLERTRVRDLSPDAKSYYAEGDFRIITKKPILPGEEEVAQNPRARSAKMRILERR